MEYKYYREIQPERALQGNFASGQINYKFKMDERSRWDPSRSYIKIKMKIRKGDDSRVDKAFGLAPNMYCADNLFQQLDMRLNGVIVSEWNDYVAQCASLKNRLFKDLNERESQLSSINYAQIDIEDRINEIASDGFKYRKYASKDAASVIGFDVATPNQFAISVANVLTFTANGGAGIPNTDTIFKLGDIIQYPGNNAAPIQAEVIIVNAGPTMTIRSSSNTQIVLGATDLADATFFRIRDKEDSQQADDIEIIWKPPLGFFDIQDELCGDYKLELTPHAEGVWQKYAVESITNRAVGTTATTFKIDITEMNMYIWTCVYASPISGEKSYTYTDIKCSSQNLTTNSLSSKIFNVHTKNHSLTLAYQEAGAGDDIRFSRSKFKIANEEELNMVRYYIQKDGITLPDPIPRLQKDSVGGVNKMTQRYYENFAYSHADRALLKKEDLRDWFKAGIYFHYKWGKGYKKSDQVSVYSNFSAAFTTNPQILLFDHYHCNISMKVVNGEVVDVVKS